MKTKLSNNPQNIDDHNWYYEEPKGLNFIHEVIKDGNYVQTDSVKVSWEKILKSVKRKYPNL